MYVSRKGEMRNALLSENLNGRDYLGGPTLRWKDNIKMDLK
jgi:hypothetical protein